MSTTVALTSGNSSAVGMCNIPHGVCCGHVSHHLLYCLQNVSVTVINDVAEPHACTIRHSRHAHVPRSNIHRHTCRPNMAVCTLIKQFPNCSIHASQVFYFTCTPAKAYLHIHCLASSMKVGPAGGCKESQTASAPYCNLLHTCSETKLMVH